VSVTPEQTQAGIDMPPTRVLIEQNDARLQPLDVLDKLSHHTTGNRLEHLRRVDQVTPSAGE